MQSINKIKIIDLFAGVGGIRLGFQQAAQKYNITTDCVYTSEIDSWACKTYSKNFPDDQHDPLNDITKIKEKEISDFDVLLAGFPCQAFSIAGRRGGFEDTRGTLFFDVARIIKEKRPKAFLLENVKGLTNHRGGKTLATIINVLRNELGYTTFYKVLNAKDYGLAQNRERIYIVGFLEGGGGFEYPKPINKKYYIRDILEENVVSPKYYISTVYLESMKRHKERHLAKGNGFGFEIKSIDGISNTIVCGGMGKERNLIIDKRLNDFTPVTRIKGEINREGIRKMTPLEWERLQGFPDNWTAGISDGHRYKQMGNSVAVPVIKKVAEAIIKEIQNPILYIDTNIYSEQLELTL